MRRHAKAVNFGIVYGISDYGLCQSLNITRKEAGDFIDRYLESYPGVKEYMEEIVKKRSKKDLSQHCYIEDRYFPEITSS